MGTSHLCILGLLLSFRGIDKCVSAVDFYGQNLENATESNAASVAVTTEIPFPGTDNGMTLGEIPEGLAAVDPFHDAPVREEVKEPEAEIGSQTTEPTLSLSAVAEDHNVFPSSPYLGSIELPPLSNEYDPYRSEYQANYNLKSGYDRKPVKFEQDAGASDYLTYGGDPHAENEIPGRGYEQTHHNRQPFPYAFESEGIPFNPQSQWHPHGDVGDQYKVGGGPEYVHVQNPVRGYEMKQNEQHNDVHHQERNSLEGWKKALHVFTALIPFGLLLATLTPSVISINSSAGQKAIGQRSLQRHGLHPLGAIFKERLQRKRGSNDTECGNEFMCKMSRMGKDQSGTYVQKRLWRWANETPDNVAEELGLKELFQAVRNDNCASFQCKETKGRD